MTDSHPAEIDYRQVFAGMNEAYILLRADDPDFTVVEMTDAYQKLTGLKRKDVVGKKILEVFPRSGTKTPEVDMVATFRACIKSKKPLEPVIKHYDLAKGKDTDRRKYWRITTWPILDKNQDVILLVSHAEDITRQRKSEDKQRAIEFQLEEALSAGLIGSWLWDIGSNSIKLDRSLAKVIGVTVQKAMDGITLDEFAAGVHESDRERVMKLTQHLLKTGVHYEVEFRLAASKTTPRWVLARGRLERDDKGAAKRLTGIIFDITARKQTELALTESEDRLRFMADAMPHLVWISRPDGYVEYYNKRWYDYTGVVIDQADNGDWSNILHPDDAKRAADAWHEALKTGEPFEVEYRLYNARNDSYRWFVARAVPFRSVSGEIAKWYGTLTDIDDYKHLTYIQTFLTKAAKKLSSSLEVEKTLKTITQLSVPHIADWCTVEMYDEEKGFRQVEVAHVDPAKVKWAKELRRQRPINIEDQSGSAQVVRTGETIFIPVVSDEMLKAAAKDEKELELLRSIGFHSAIIVPIKTRGQTVGAISFISSDSQRYYNNDDLRMAEKLSSHISLAMTNAKLYDDAQAEIAARRQLEKELRDAKDLLEKRVKERTRELENTNAGLTKEIARRKEAEEKLQIYSESLARSNQELQDFAYVASHDLQEPLRKIQAFGNLVQDEYGKELGEGSDYLDRMRAAASRMSVLIEDLLAFSRVTTKARPFVDVDLNKIVADVLVDLETRIEETDGIVKIEELPTIKADATQMRQLFQNLISNALKFHKPGVPPQVKVAAKEVDGSNPHYLITVKDNGIGFDEKYLDRIFAVFQRLHGRESYDGTGIGLAVCRKIVERHGGTITAKSKRGSGAIFGVALPKKVKEKTQ